MGTIRKWIFSLHWWVKVSCLCRMCGCRHRLFIDLAHPQNPITSLRRYIRSWGVRHQLCSEQYPSISLSGTQFLSFHSKLRSFLHRIGVEPDGTCACYASVETTQHFLLECHLYHSLRAPLLHSCRSIPWPPPSHLFTSSTHNLGLFKSFIIPNACNLYFFCFCYTQFNECAFLKKKNGNHRSDQLIQICNKGNEPCFIRKSAIHQGVPAQIVWNSQSI